MDSFTGMIRTPDQRLRIFVSSTLKELGAERRAARIAIERLHLAPVMFELGARPHPPRELYRAYLQQSDVFVGLYWERYGWVAPGETVSGLEDEYILAPGLPKLIYIKETTDAREPRLADLLDRIRDDDTASFKYFSDAEELGELLVADLATLLAERFDQSRGARIPDATPDGEAAADDSGSITALPAPLTQLIGRQKEAQDIERMLRLDRARLVTLTGPGGIGKSRLSIDVAQRVVDDFGGGVHFVDLAPVRDPALVITAIAQGLGVRDTGDGPIDDKLRVALKRRRMLLVLDNFEQVIAAAPMIRDLLVSSPDVTFLVTSRSLLRVSGERSYEVGPLSMNPAVELFVERARAVRPDFELTAENTEAVERICAALEGVPLAIELAAARMRVLTPSAILPLLDRQLSLLVGGVRDLPARQQAVRSTIEWSARLLGERESGLLAKLGVFVGGFTLDAAEFVSEASRLETLDTLGALVDSSLVQQHDRNGSSYFSMLAAVREYSAELLGSSGDLENLRRRHARYYVALGEEVEHELEGFRQRQLVNQLAGDHDNLRAAARFLLDKREWETAASFGWTFFLYWWVGGRLGEVRGWMEEVLATADPLPNRSRAIALYFTHAITFWQEPDERVIPGLTESADLFHREDDASGEALALVSLALALLASAEPDPVGADEALETSLGLFRGTNDLWGETMSLVTLGRVALLQQKVHGALNRFDEALSLARGRRDELGVTIALHHLGWAHLLLGDQDTAKGSFDESLAISARLGHDEGIAYGLEGLVAVAATAGDIRRAGLLLGASQCLREQKGLYNAPTFSFHQASVAPILASDSAADFESARIEGRRLSSDAAVDLAAQPTEGERNPS